MGPFLKALRPHAPSNAGRSGASRRPLARPRSATDPLGSPAISGRAPRGPPAQFASEQSIEASPRLPLQSNLHNLPQCCHDAHLLRTTGKALPYLGAQQESHTTGWFHGIDVLVV